MTETLVQKVCTPCRGGIPALSPDEVARYASQLPDWAVEHARRIERTYRFGNFREALAFVDQVGALAEAERHHPDVCFGWGYATVSLQTHKIKGLHENDFILAAKVGQLAASLG